MKHLTIEGLAILTIAIGINACQQPKTVEKEVIKEVYKPTDIQVLKAQYDLQASLF
ncbi:hypothetical protein [Flagellimonas flava]|uniref:hypothetical protein n=1 Tax=Flagellimonas flava TaxID=570519 RepID=UPI003D6603AE